LSRTIYSQTSIFVIEYCLLKLWESWGVKPDYVLGHSLGEFGAAVAAGILKFEDALKLVAERSRLIDGLPGGKMVVIKENHEKVDMLVKFAFKGSDRWLDYAAVNSPEQTVMAGSEENVEFFSEFCKNNQIKTHILDATHAFHSRHMDPILEEYRKVAATVEYMKPSCLFVSGMEGQIVEEDDHVSTDYWVRHTRDSVRFASASKAIMEKGCGLFLEVGPQPVLCALTMINSDGVEGLENPVVCLPSIRRQDKDWPLILGTLGKLYTSGVEIDWKRFDQFSDVKKVSVPFYPFQNKPYWFEFPDIGPGEIHPLVGTSVSNASAMKLYKNKLEIENVPFLSDHAIGNKIIFPGAGFLEMCLVSGHAATQCSESGYFSPPNPITLEDFAIEAPLGLSEVGSTELQVIVTTEDSGETRVAVYSKLVLDKETHKWVKHASATFSPYAMQSKVDEAARADSFESIKTRCANQVVITETYEKLAEFGLKFGPTFQTLKNLWKGDDNECLFEVAVTAEPQKYICHPVISDALFQAIMFTMNPEANKLHVPVSVSKFIWFAKIETDSCFIHCAPSSNDEVVAVLYDSNGQALAQMVGATLMETTVAAIMSALEAQRMSLPSMYEDIWKAQLGSMEKRVDPEEIFEQSALENTCIQPFMEKHNVVSDEDRIFTEKSDHLYSLYMLKAFHDLGWSPNVGETYEVKKVTVNLKILASLEGFLRYMLMELSSVEGFFEVIDSSREQMSFRLIKPIPNSIAIIDEINLLYTELKPQSTEIDYVSSTGRNLASFLTGKDSALPYLFPEDPSAVSAEAYYMDARVSKTAHALGHDYISILLKKAPAILENKKGTVRILEVGAGTGSFTKAILPLLQGPASGWEFTYTDLSSIFFQKGQKIFEDSKIKVLYRILNIEEDPMSQGYIPHHYDMIIANNVVHATKSISETMGNLRNLLRDNGILLVSESIKPFRATNLTFGLLDAYWRFEDFDLRPYNCEISLEKWDKVLKSRNFSRVAGLASFGNTFGLIAAQAEPHCMYIPHAATLSTKKSTAWIVFSNGDEISSYFIDNLIEQGNQVVTVTKSDSHYKQLNSFEYEVRTNGDADVEDMINSITKGSNLSLDGVIFLWGLNRSVADYEAICRPYLSICKALIPFNNPKLYALTRGIAAIGDSEVSQPAPSPIWAMTKCLQNEHPNSSCRCIDLDLQSELSEDKIQEAFAELFVDDQEIYVAYRGNQRHVMRFNSWKPPSNVLSFPKTERFHLLLPPTNAINDLRFGPMEKSVPQESQVEVRVKSFALNFRDVFAVLKPSLEFETMNTVGIDFAGVVCAVGPIASKFKVGDAVFGCNLNGDALPSHIVVPEEQLVSIPDLMTFNEAATLPAVAATAFLSLVQVAKLTANDTILIHTGSGGVGLVAIQIAQAVGATIVTTAGSKRKRTCLRRMGIEHVFHSRNTSYEKDIRKALNGKGVDVVLNSLTSEGFKEASLAVCNEGARFIEMSKLNVWTPEEVKNLRPDVQYTIVDLSSSTGPEMRSLLENVSEYMGNAIIQPIPHTRFDVSEVREALGYLQKAKHIGKIVCTMPDTDLEVSPIGGTNIPMFNDRSTYLITGGLGGIGLELAKWMAQSGAKHIALVGRNPPNNRASEEILRLNAKGKNVFCMHYDVGNFDQCKTLLESLKSEDLNLPPLRGIMHAAGVLSDAIYANQSWEKYQATYNPKVNGALNLHELTMNYPLEHFVMFSSAVASMGSMGQSNHASANFFLDSLVNYRNYIGLNASTVNWGQWGQVGVAANIEIVGLKPFSPLQGISALERALKSQKSQICVCDADFSIIRQVFNGNRKYMEDLKLKQTDLTKEIMIDNEQFWNDFDGATDEEGRLEVVKRFVRSMIRQILKFSKDDPMSDDENFQDMGMDSLMMIEMKNVVQSTLGKRATITVNSVKDCHTVNELSTKLVSLLSGENDVPPPTREELVQLIREDSELPVHITPSTPHCLPSHIKTVLLTGVTGNLGPYFLRDIANRPHIDKVICLIRAEKTSSPEERLSTALDGKSMSGEIPMDKIICVNGSVTKSKLGMSSEQYDDLSQTVDAVVHLAVKSSFVDQYKRIEKGDTDIRTVNVKGTLNVLEFVCSMKTKVMFHASSIVSNANLDEELTLDESWPKPDDFDEMPNSAYPISKFVCDRLMAQAVDRGVPVKVFRFPAVGGDSRSGANVAYDNNQLMLRLMSYLHLGFMPAIPIPFFILPVDVCSDLSLRVFFDDSTEYDLYNVYNPYAHNETELVLIGEDLGFRLDILEPEEFQAKLATVEDSILVHFLKEASDNKDAHNRFLKDSPSVIKAWTRNPEKAFVSRKLSRIIPEYPRKIENTLAVIKRDLAYARSSGIFDKFGLKLHPYSPDL
jgi:thioester reductase-like protein